MSKDILDQAQILFGGIQVRPATMTEHVAGCARNFQAAFFQRIVEDEPQAVP